MNNSINRKLAALLILCAMMCFCALNAMAQACTPPLWQGFVNSCSSINLRWLNRDNSTLIEKYEIYIGTQLRGTSPGSALGFSDRVGCNFGANYTIKQIMKTGATCQMVTTGGPHSFPCNLCGNGGLGTTVVSSANFRGSVSRNSLVSFFPDTGVTFTDQQAFATTIPLPTVLAGVTVSIDGQLLGLVSVAPGQINAYLPEWLPEGPTEIFAAINTTRGSVPSFTGRPQLNPNAPGIFTAAANGTGQAASVWLVVKPNGQQNYYAPGQLQFSGGDLVLLVLYATGINESQCELFLGNGSRFTAQYCGPSGFVGVTQINVIIPTNQIWQGSLGGYVRVGVPGRLFDSQGVDFRAR